MKPVVLTHAEWKKIFDLIKEEYPPSVAIISWKRREKLGFHVRTHTQWVQNEDYNKQYNQYIADKKDPGNWLLCEPSKGASVDVICLDFYDEKKRTMFLLKYGDMISSENKWNK